MDLSEVFLFPYFAVEFDQRQVCRWIHGQVRLGPGIILFCRDNVHPMRLLNRMKNKLLPLMPGSAMAVL